MKTMKSVYIALFGTLLLVAGSVSVWAQAAQQTGDQTKSDSTAAAKGKKKSTSKKADAADKSATADTSTTPKKTRSKKSATSIATDQPATPASGAANAEIGRASCRERV